MGLGKLQKPLGQGMQLLEDLRRIGCFEFEEQEITQMQGGLNRKINVNHLFVRELLKEELRLHFIAPPRACLEGEGPRQAPLLIHKRPFEVGAEALQPVLILTNRFRLPQFR